MEIKCFTDGSLVNEGQYKGLKAGAWAYKIIMNESTNHIEYGKQVTITSTLIEIEAIKQLLLKLNEIINNINDVEVIIYSDCQTIVNTVNSIINKEKIKLKNKTRIVYNEIVNLIKSFKFKISLEWIKGHNKNDISEYNIHNDEVDILARINARMLAKELKSNKSKKVKKTKKKGYGTPFMITKAPEKIDRYVYYSNIEISNRMRNSPPRENKKLNKFELFTKNNSIEKPIEVRKLSNGMFSLVDGYISYLWLREMNEQWIPIKLV